jgi:hypothetical protein
VKNRTEGLLVIAGAAVIAVASARGFAGGWWDGSRLATVEALVDHHTLAIDHSIFVEVPPRAANRPDPYLPDQGGTANGTGDKMYIRGHFYSDKPPVPALLMAGEYQVWQWATGLTARQRPDLFCYVLTVGSSGLAYVVAVWCVYQLGVGWRLPRTFRLALPLSLALATLAPVYARHVNNHILLLGAAAALTLGLVCLAREVRAGQPSRRRLLGVGALTGLGYAIELAAGPALLAGTLALVAYRCRRLGAVAWFTLAALPWVVLHHAINYALADTLRPAGSIPENFQWPGSAFTAGNLTGGFMHHSVGEFLSYAAALLVGERGFLNYNPTLLLTVPALLLLLRRAIPEWPEILWAACWGGGLWLAYSLFSNNYGGGSSSIRWLVPLLAPGYLVLALFLRDYPRYGWAFLLISGWGLVLAFAAWKRGPWQAAHQPLVWLVFAGTLLSGGVAVLRRQLRYRPALPVRAGESMARRRAA